MSKEVRVAEATVDDAVRVNATVIEFDEPYDQRHFEERINGKNHLILVGSVDGKPAGGRADSPDLVRQEIQEILRPGGPEQAQIAPGLLGPNHR